MPQLASLRADELRAYHQRIRERYDAFARRGLKLNLTRGKPSAAQLDLCNELLALPGRRDFMAGDGRLPQLRRAARPARAARAARADLRCDARSRGPRRQLQPRPHARRRRLCAAEGHVRQRTSVVEGVARRFHLPGARLRSALLDLRGVRHRDDHGAAAATTAPTWTRSSGWSPRIRRSRACGACRNTATRPARCTRRRPSSGSRA